MKLKNSVYEGVGGVLSIKGQPVDVSRDGIIDIKDEDIAKVLLANGWRLVEKDAPEKQEDKKERPKFKRGK